MGDQNIFNLGEHGVVLTPTPLHTKDGSFARAQNLEFFLDRGKGGIRQRPPLRRLSASAADAAYGLGPVLLGDPFALTIYVQRFGLTTWRVSTNGGSTWADASGPTVPLAGAMPFRGQNVSPPLKILKVKRHSFYHYIDPNDAFGDNGLAVYDGARGFSMGYSPRVDGTSNIRMTDPAQLHGLIYAAKQVFDSVTWAVFSVNPSTGEIVQLPLPYLGTVSARVTTGNTEVPIAMVAYLGKLWMITQATGIGNTSRVLSARPGDTAWTVERTLAFGTQWYYSAAVYRGELYVSQESSGGGGSHALIEKRTVAGVWSTVLTGAQFAGVAHTIGGLTVYQDALYGVEYRDGSATQTMKVHKFNGSAWSIDDSIAVPLSGGSGAFVLCGVNVIGQALYLSGLHGVRRKLSGAWADVSTGITSTSQFPAAVVAY